MTTTMRQVQMNRYGSPEVLTLIKTDIPRPRAGELLIKVAAIGVNYADTLRRRNLYFEPTPLPYVLGSEAVGEVIALGEAADPDLMGARVLAVLPAGGGYSEYAIALAAYCVPLPPGLDAKTATAIFVQGSTAELMVAQLAGDMKGKTVLVNAASGGVGSLLVQLTKQRGARVIAAAGSEDKLTKAASNGADITIKYDTENWSEELKKHTEGLGVDIAFDAVGGEVYNETLKSLATGGKLIVFGCAGGVQGHIHPEYFVDRNISQFGFNLAFYITKRTAIWQEAFGAVIGMIAKGELRIDTSNSFPLEEAANVHSLIEARKTMGKVVLTVS